jgi:hypothetical protein
VASGDVAALARYFEQRHAWGTWESWYLMRGVQSSALLHGNAVIGLQDRDALVHMVQRDRSGLPMRRLIVHSYGFIEARLLWEKLEPGKLAASIPPGMVLSADYMLELIDKQGAPKLCSGRQLADNDRAVLTRALTSGRSPTVTDQVKRSLQAVDDACHQTGLAS